MPSSRPLTASPPSWPTIIQTTMILQWYLSKDDDDDDDDDGGQYIPEWLLIPSSKKRDEEAKGIPSRSRKHVGLILAAQCRRLFLVEGLTLHLNRTEH